MKANVGTIDRIARLILGVLVLAAPFATSLALFQTAPMTVLAVIVGLVLIGTSAMKFCPLYRLLGMNTCQI